MVTGELTQLLTEYGYWVILIGTFLEGESIVILAGTLAHQGYLSLPWVCLCAFAGSLASDQLMFHIGQRYGQPFIERRQKLRVASARVSRWLERNETLLILGFRFVYGVRNVTPIMLGAHGVNGIKFLVLNVIGAAVWAVAFGLVGYLFGTAVEKVFGRIAQAHHLVLLLFGIAILGFGVWHLVRRYKA